MDFRDFALKEYTHISFEPEHNYTISVQRTLLASKNISLV